jgi:hypothetical protein
MTRERYAAPESAASSAMPTSSSPAAPISDLARRQNILARLPAEDRAFLEELILPRWRLRQRRLDERDAALRALAVDQADRTGWRVARRISKKLAIYVNRGSWRFDREPPANPRRAAMFRAVRLKGGKVPSRTTIWRALAGRPSPSPKSTEPMGC